jgi:hypothetical protein
VEAPQTCPAGHQLVPGQDAGWLAFLHCTAARYEGHQRLRYGDPKCRAVAYAGAHDPGRAPIDTGRSAVAALQHLRDLAAGVGLHLGTACVKQRHLSADLYPPGGVRRMDGPERERRERK